MKSGLKYTTFSSEKSINELLFNISIWNSEFEFIEIELSFLKHLIKTYPFQVSIPNLFERLQLFILDLDNLEEDQVSIIQNLSIQKNQLKNKSIKEDFNYDTFNLKDYDNLTEEIFNYLVEYKKIKIKIYQYINGLIK
tara:strand:- start:38530 stop:38943 length:414 start_codon:yes stop_codon:yes gene_type:complete